MTNRQKYCLFQDDDCHWYMVPWERRAEAMGIIESIEQYWESDWEKGGKCPDKPEWIQEVDGPHGIVFEAPCLALADQTLKSMEAD